MLKNLFGGLALEGTLQKIAQGIQQLSSSLGRVYPDAGGNLRVVSSGGSLVSVTTVSSVTNAQAIGGYQASYDQYAAMQGNAQCVRAQIRVSP